MTNPADAAKLLPCPFMQDGYSHELRVTDVIPGEYRVRCSCGARGPIGSTEEEASERWNTRPQPAPLDVVLHCPHCKEQHIDKADPANDWTNPPHKSHLCHNCGAIWRAADWPTNGVESAATRRSSDCDLKWPIAYQATQPGGEPVTQNAEEIIRYVAGCVRRGIVLPQADAWADALQRVADGLAARPKVKDAEVALAVANIREYVHIDVETRDKQLNAAANLLERLAEEVTQYKRAECRHFENIAELATMLDEREAELAKAADALRLVLPLAKAYVGTHPVGSNAAYIEQAEKFIDQSAARQKQKASAE